MNIGVNGIIKSPLVDYPVSNLNIDLFYHILDSTALDPFLYDGGKYVIGSILYNKKLKLNQKSSLSFTSGIKLSLIHI